MVSNKFIFYLSLIAILLIIAIPTISKINEKHIERLFIVETSKISEKALLCYMENKCTDSKISLKELIEKEYLVRGIDPRTNEYFKDDVYVIITDHKPTLFIDGQKINYNLQY